MAKKQKADFTDFYAGVMDEIEARQGGSSGLDDAMPEISSGMLAYDTVMGMGIRPAWYTTFGPEQSAKTTGALTIVAHAIRQGVPVINLSDYEGSTANARGYVSSIFQGSGLKLSMEEIFGRRGKDGKWITPPRVRYHAETVAERFFDRLHNVLKELPDKKKFGDKWYLIFPDDKKHAYLKDRAVEGMAKKYGRGIYIEAEDGKLQAIFVVDSYPAMNPEANDEEDDNNSLALQARMFSKQFPRVKGRLAPKMVAVIGVNQLRQAPMVRYGPPDYEPGGQALRFNSDVRVRHTPRAISGVNISPKPKPDKEDSGTEREPSVEFEGGSDIYRYVQIKGDKNKLWTPKRKAWIRIWQEDGSGKARGLDPVFDVWQYLVTTGQASGKNKKVLKFNLAGLGEGRKTITWVELKLWILGKKDDKVAVSKKLGYPPMDLKKFCFKQMASGDGEAMYVAKQQQKSKASDEDDE